MASSFLPHFFLFIFAFLSGYFWIAKMLQTFKLWVNSKEYDRKQWEFVVTTIYSTPTLHVMHAQRKEEWTPPATWLSFRAVAKPTEFTRDRGDSHSSLWFRMKEKRKMVHYLEPFASLPIIAQSPKFKHTHLKIFIVSDFTLF